MKVLSVAMILSLSCVVFGCAMEDASTEPEVDNTADAITAVDCNGRPGSCDRGDVCLQIDRAAYCSSGDRCLDARDCRAGYVCRASHCLAVQRDRVIDRRAPLRDADVHARRRWAAAHDSDRNTDDARGR